MAVGADQTTSLRGDPHAYLNMKVALPDMERQTSNKSNGGGGHDKKIGGSRALLISLSQLCQNAYDSC
jgi:hypothetical protein